MSKQKGTSMSKIDQAKAIVAANPQASRSDLIQMFMNQLSMSKAGATTYYYNATKGTAAKSEGPHWPSRKPKAVKPASSKRKLTAEQIKSAKKFSEYHNKKVKSRAEEEMERLAKRDEMMVETEEYLNEAREYLQQHAPNFLRKELGLL